MSKKVIRITESELKGLIQETLTKILDEGIFDKALEKGYNVGKHIERAFNPKIKDDIAVYDRKIKERNPFTYNKKDFNPFKPEKGSKEYKQRLEKASDRLLMQNFYFYVDELEKDIKEGNQLSEESRFHIENTISFLKEAGLTKYAEYLRRLYKMCIKED